MRALGALPSDEAGALLVDTALDDTDPETGRSAEAVLAALGPNECRGAAQAMERHLVERPGKAYALLGRLRLLGGHIRVAHPSWPLRLRRALGLWNEQRRGRGWRYWVRGAGSAFYGAWLGLVVAGVAHLALDLDAGAETNPFIALLLACVLVPVAAPWITPTQLHYDRIAGTLSDGLYGAVLCIGLTAVVWAASRTSPDIIALFVVSPLVVVTVRFAVSLFGGSVRIPGLGFLWTVTCAGFAGILAAWLGIFVVAGVFDYDLERITVGMASCVFAFSLAWMFTALDKPSADSVALLAQGAVPGALAARFPAVPWPRSNIHPLQAHVFGAAVCSLFCLLVVLSIPGRVLVRENLIAKGPEIRLQYDAGVQTRRVESVPIQYDVSLDRRGLVAIECTRAPDDAKDYRVELERVGEPATTVAQFAAAAQSRQVISVVVSQPRITSSATVDPGQYRLRVLRIAEEETTLARVARRALMRLRMASKVDAQLDIGIELAPEPAIGSRK